MFYYAQNIKLLYVTTLKCETIILNPKYKLEN